MSKSPIALFDSHIHLDDPRYADTLPVLMENAKARGVIGAIIPGTVADEFSNIESITQSYENCYGAYGLHPYFMAMHTESDLEIVEQYLKKGQAVAVGECGLDAMIDTDMDAQLALFKAHIRLALEYDLPLIIHTRKTVDLVLKEIRKHPNLRGVFHSFSGSIQQAEIIRQHNFLMGFGGPVTFDRAQKLQRLVKHLTLDDFVLETDGPFQAGSHRINDLHYPEDLRNIAEYVATLRGDSLESLSHATTTNTKNLFKL
ncbi:TatD family hydrolase [Wohlfahrtiimonas chitiniclastica]|uniref:TatD family hydrolase n=1 Tax=Wohlfahrtiimonas chitiniclastica TaxID=400946 RepID=UPI001BD1A724|nr:TatD family hydrolase [Wohlfahrtiimonas chitiniclastica]MBS7828909.1 TatD family hydrolase [Wohlfahrtiimonas chitiniclastica]